MVNIIQHTKNKRLVDYASDNPLYVIDEVFNTDILDNIKDCCYRWFKLAIINENAESPYQNDKEIAGLLAFYYNLLPLLEALHIIYYTREKVKRKCPEYILLDQEQQVNPLQVVNNFCNSFTLEYIHRELKDWLRAGIIYEDIYPDIINEADVLSIHDFILCLTEAAHGLYKQEQDNQLKSVFKDYFSSCPCIYLNLWTTNISKAV